MNGVTKAVLSEGVGLLNSVKVVAEISGFDHVTGPKGYGSSVRGFDTKRVSEVVSAIEDVVKTVRIRKVTGGEIRPPDKESGDTEGPDVSVRTVGSQSPTSRKPLEQTKRETLFASPTPHPAILTCTTTLGEALPPPPLVDRDIPGGEKTTKTGSVVINDVVGSDNKNALVPTEPV